MDERRILETAMLAGEIMSASGAESYRVEDTMNRILHTADAKSAEAFAVVTGVFATLETENEVVTRVKRIAHRDINLAKIAEVNEISRLYCQNQITLETAYDRLQHFTVRSYSKSIHNLAILLLVLSFSFLLGGGIQEGVLASINGVLLIGALLLVDRAQVTPFLRTLFASTVIAFGASFLKSFIMKDAVLDNVIIASMMPLVPGTAITTAIRDTLNGDYMSGGSRALESVVIAVSIALGVGAGLWLWRALP